MKAHFLNLDPEIQSDILKSAENQFSIPALILEKDIWICWLLEQLFTLPIKMAFKGGTSLSKVFNLIHRFSEDVDVSIDYQNFENNLDLSTKSRAQIKKISDKLKIHLKIYTENTVLPFLREKIQNSFHIKFDLILNENGEDLKLYYPTALRRENYLRDHVLIEFGARNHTEPNEIYTITPTLTQIINQNFELPIAKVNTLSPLRTFWEKATLMHVECHRDRLHETPDRLSRHWYDLFMLHEAKISDKALSDKKILKSVIEHKKGFYNASYANYDQCTKGNFKLLPNETGLKGLQQDFNKMRQAGMFSKEPPKFNEIVHSLTHLEKIINATQF